MNSLAIFLAALSTPMKAFAIQDAACTQSVYAPIPSNSVGLAVSNVTGYRVETYGNGAYMITDGMYQSLFLVSGESVIVVDAPPTTGHDLLYAIGNVTDLPVSHLIYSHAHADHIGAAYLYSEAFNVSIVAHALTAEELALVGKDPHRPAPTITFHDSYTLTVGNQTLELSYKGPNHEPGNIFVWAPAQQVLMVVDIVFPGWVPFAYLGEAQSVPGYIKAHHDILTYNFTHYIGGHLDRSGTRADVETQLQYVTDLYDNCATAIALTGNSSSAISAAGLEKSVEASNPGNQWALFKAVLDATCEYCVNVTNRKWLGTLAGADVFGFENAWIMVNSLRIDFDVLGPFGVTH